MTKTSTPIPYRPDSEHYFSRLCELPYSVWLDSGKPSSTYGRYDIISAVPRQRLVTNDHYTELTTYECRITDGAIQLHFANSSKTNSDPTKALQKALDDFKNKFGGPSYDDKDLPFIGGAIGYFGYDLGKRYHGLNTDDKTAFPQMQVGLYDWAFIQDHQEQQSWLVALPGADTNLLKRIRNCLLSDKASKTSSSESFLAGPLQSNTNREAYLTQLERIHEYILAGDCYQVNFSQQFSGPYQGSPYSAYRILREIMASPFSAYLTLEQGAVLSLSPERFLQVRDGLVLTQPIKGTTKRSPETIVDELKGKALQNSDKNRAENLMIVDLLRNDLGQHCQPGSINVEKLFDLESFPNVHHLVSTISGQLQLNSTSLDLLRDCFPGGSITGAPKRRAMEIIEELESAARNIYCGSIGYINHKGDMDTNIAIRTVSCDGERLYCSGGGGIVADSNPESEYQESLDKIQAILKVLTGEL